MNIYTGNATVDSLAQFSITGNIIPSTWFKTITNEKGKPLLRAIMFLSDIVYWYRPMEIRDEATGAFIRYCKKFQADLLRRSYQELAEQFGCSKGEAQSAIADLERIGIVKRVFRTEIHHGIRSNNILYLALNVDVLKEVTYPQEEENTKTAMPKNRDRVSPQKRGTVPQKHDTNTEIISENNYIEIIPSTNQSIPKEIDPIEEVERNRCIPFHYFGNENLIRPTIKYLCQYNDITPADFCGANNTEQYNAFRLIVDCLIEMTCEKKPQYYHESYVANGIKVIEKINDCIKQDHYLNFFISMAIEDFLNATDTTKIKNVKKYMKSVVWTSLSSYKVEFDAFFRRTQHEAL